MHVYRVGSNAQPSDMDGAPGWYWSDDDGETHGPYPGREDAQQAMQQANDDAEEADFEKRFCR